MYTEELHINLDFNLAVDVLIASSKYSISKLNAISQEFIIKSLTIENAFEILILAESLKARNLKKCTFDLIVKNFEKFNVTDFFKLTGNYPELLAQIMGEVALKCASKKRKCDVDTSSASKKSTIIK